MIEKRSHRPSDAGKGRKPKPPEDWVTANEPMTEAQRLQLRTLCKRCQQPFEGSLSKVLASRRIEELEAVIHRRAAKGTPEH
ncbi:MAG: DUF3072 domain-containing protein [Pseudomonadota bacterium]